MMLKSRWAHVNVKLHFFSLTQSLILLLFFKLNSLIHLKGTAFCISHTHGVSEVSDVSGVSVYQMYQASQMYQELVSETSEMIAYQM